MIYGFVAELLGHVEYRLDPQRDERCVGRVQQRDWDETTGRFRFDRRNGFCSY